jgi:hypothetical protein
MRSTSLKKYATTIQKNQSTSKDDIFIKPDPSKVTGMKKASYDKLDESGNAPPETVIDNGEIIIGKVSPIQPVGNTNKTFKDSSEVYKSYIPGTVDRVWKNIYNNEGYEMRKMRVRSERTPQIGDKVKQAYVRFKSCKSLVGGNTFKLRKHSKSFQYNSVYTTECNNLKDWIIRNQATPKVLTAQRLDDSGERVIFS